MTYTVFGGTLNLSQLLSRVLSRVLANTVSSIESMMKFLNFKEKYEETVHAARCRLY